MCIFLFQSWSHEALGTYTPMDKIKSWVYIIFCLFFSRFINVPILWGLDGESKVNEFLGANDEILLNPRVYIINKGCP